MGVLSGRMEVRYLDNAETRYVLSGYWGKASHLPSITRLCLEKHEEQYFLKAYHHLLMGCETSLMGCYKHIYIYLFLF